MFLAAPVAVAAGAAYAYMRPGEKPEDKPEEEQAAEGEQAAEAADDSTTKCDDGAQAATPSAEPAAGNTWRKSSGRESGPEGYVFGDLTRGVVVRLRGGPKSKEEEAIEAEADEQYSHVQVLVRDAVRIFRARGYAGTINMTQTVGHFSESTSVRVDGPKDDVAPWEAADHDVATEAVAVAMGEHGRAGKVFTTLLARLERRASSWQDFSGCEGLDPNLTSSAHIGFALPVIKIGWGVSVSLTVSTSSLLRYAKYATGQEYVRRSPITTGDHVEQAEQVAHDVAASMGCE